MSVKTAPDQKRHTFDAGTRRYDAPATVQACVKERLDQCSYSRCFNRVTWHYAGGTLILEGCVPSFYLKQILQTMLQDLEHVNQIANEVAVISSTGLSSEANL